MSEMSILNIFNYLFISPIRVYISHDEVTVRRQHGKRNIIFLAVLVTTVAWVESWYLVENFENATSSISVSMTLLKYFLNMVNMYVVLYWMTCYGAKVLGVYNGLIALNVTLGNISRASHVLSYRYSVLKLLLSLVLIWGGLLAGYHVGVQWYYHIMSVEVCLIVLGNTLIEVVMDLHKMCLIFFGIFLSQSYDHLRLLLFQSNATVQMTIFAVVDRLYIFKRRLTEAFGLLLFLLTFQSFVACSTHAYLMIVLSQLEYPGVAFCVNTVLLTVYITLFYSVTYFYDSIEVKESEFKNALKSMQYTGIENQSGAQKDFYDLINLKLMMQSPKITACGLFEVNLQIFYNVFAAIITYIVILFQFRSFEKSP